MRLKKQVYQLKISLQGIMPIIWRRIQVLSNYTFWNLHVVIQEAFAWNDSHLHRFTCAKNSDATPIVIGIPLEPAFEDENFILPGWEHEIRAYITFDSCKIEYTYGFEDNWQHGIELEEILPIEQGITYPRCIAGQRNSPPEDCGGVFGYQNLLMILEDPEHDEYESTREWVDSKKGPFDPKHFNPSEVKFVCPNERFMRSFEEE